MLCQIGELGAGIGGSSVLMKFSRGFERDADLNGARMIASAGYDPMQLPHFFEKLQAKAGTNQEPRGLSLWLSSHPATGSRIQYVAEDVRFYPQREYTANTGNFPRVKQIVASFPPPKPKPAFLILAKKDAAARGDLPPGFKDYQANGFAIAFPANWQVGQAEAGGSRYLIPRDGAARGRNGGVELLAGAMLDYYRPQNDGAAVHLDRATTEFIGSLQKGDPELRAGKPQRVDVGGQPALMTRLNTRISGGESEQIVYLYTLAREAGLWYIALASPAPRLEQFDPVFQQMIRTVQFPN